MESEKPEANYLICGRANGQYRPVEGSRPAVCSLCGRGVWIAPSGRKLKAEHDLAIACFDCFEQERLPDAEIAPTTPEQLAELTPRERKLSQRMIERWRQRKKE